MFEALGSKLMNREVRELLDKVQDVPDFLGTDLRDINDKNAFGDNALHCVCVWGDIDAAKLLVENGINIDQKGEGGVTPLKMAHDFGFKDLVEYLISVGADMQSLHREFEYNLEADSKHISMLKEELKKTEKAIRVECDKNA